MVSTSWVTGTGEPGESGTQSVLFVGQQQTKTIRHFVGAGATRIGGPRASARGRRPVDPVSARRQKMSFPYKALRERTGFVSPSGDAIDAHRGPPFFTTT